MIPKELELYRITHPLLGSGDHTCGFFVLPSLKKEGPRIRVMFSEGGGWEHASVSLEAERCPTWEEMEHVRQKFFGAESTVMQLHAPRSTWRSLHPYCLHLWRPMYQDIPVPDPILVGTGE